MQHVEVKLELVSPLGLPASVSMPKGATKTGAQTRFPCIVIHKGESTLYCSVSQAWEQLGFADNHYGFGSRVQIQVARDGLSVVEHGGEVFTFVKGA